MKKLLFYSVSAVCFLVATAFSIQQIINWKIEAEKAQVEFSLNAHGQEVKGNFKGVKGEIKFDEKDLANSSFNCSIDVATINTGVTERDGHLQAEQWFDAAKYPTISFTSSEIHTTKNETPLYVATGTLSIKGVTKDLSIPFSFGREKPSAAGTGIFSGDFTINRSDFGIGKAGGDMGDEVKIHLEIPVTKEK